MNPEPMLSAKPTGGTVRVLGEDDVDALVAMREETKKKKDAEEDEEEA